MTDATTGQSLTVRDLGRMRYNEALAIQRELNQAVIDGDGPPTLLLVEHEPVITITPRKGIAEHLLAPADRLNALGIEVVDTDRGGDITYHGPGQLVVYPIINLNRYQLNLGRYMRLLEQVVIDTVAEFAIKAERVERCTGVWVTKGPRVSGFKSQEGQGSSNLKPETCDLKPNLAKLCAIGIRVRRSVTMHGLAINVTTELSHFDTIVPCGLANRAVTSLSQLLGERTPTMDAVKATLVGRFEETLASRR